MTGKKLIVVSGITGTQGSSVANHFLKHDDWRIRGITRNPGSEKAKAWTAKGVELVQADQDDVQSLKRAFKGANAIFSVTDYTTSYTKVAEDETLQKKAAAEGKTINEYAADLEVAQGINIATAASDPEVLATLERFVLSTLTGIKRASGGKYKNACQFDSKAEVENYVREAKPELSKRMSTVNMGSYLENWRSMPLFGPQKEPDGTYTFLRLKWPGTHEAHPEVWASKDTGAFVEALVLQHPPGTNVLGASEVISKADYAALWGRVMGVKATVKDTPEEEFSTYLPEELKDEMMEYFKFIAEYGYTGGNASIKTPAELGILTTPLERFIKGEDWSSVMK
ncbi:hypothetical protein DL764_002909 [Monosporascus ibericus]|uniref:NmrA-like domain-containing protein n=1 Tax=Monosporascus ibericus TaxID=155417 RepID=A0A4Q4TIM8_9PEZI|nr:hypothetical protein DL764_002909 [Monosporascus ibericus]